MASIRPRFEFEFNPAGLTGKIAERAGRKFREEAETIGREMVNEVQRIVASEYNNPDPKPNQTRLANSFTYKVEAGSGPGGFPIKVTLTIKPGVSAGKVGALNWGVKRITPHRIEPRNVPRALELKNPNMAQARRSGSTGRFTKQAAKGSQYEGRVLRPYVNHPGGGPKRGGLFMERAREIVLRRHGYGG